MKKILMALVAVVAAAVVALPASAITDGSLDGDAHPYVGLMVAQDGRNLAPPERQNFKYASWQDIAAALGLD